MNVAHVFRALDRSIVFIQIALFGNFCMCQMLATETIPITLISDRCNLKIMPKKRNW